MLTFDPSLQGLAVDPKALSELKRRAQSDEDGALRAAARQFEVLLLDLVMKSMRANAPGETELDNAGTRMFTGMLDQEFTRGIAQRGGLGLADLMVKQLSQLRGRPGQEGAAAADNLPRTSGAA